MEEYERRFRIPKLTRVCDTCTPYNDETPLYAFGIIAGEQVRVATVRDVYLQGLDDAPPLRHRTQRYRATPASYELCTKLGQAPRRQEYRWAAGPSCEGKPIGTVAKVRFEWERGPLKLHIEYAVDCHGVGGWVAEVEGPQVSVNLFCAHASWVEVTGDSRFSNLALATKGWPK